jgi:hypothetical protein
MAYVMIGVEGKGIICIGAGAVGLDYVRNAQEKHAFWCFSIIKAKTAEPMQYFHRFFFI